MKSICVVTGTRAEYGLLFPVISRLRGDAKVDLRLVVTGTHLSEKYGCTKNEIISSGFTSFTEIQIKTESSSNEDIAVAVGDAMIKYADYLKKDKPDMVLLLGDRYEIFAFASAAAIAMVPIAHMYGGDRTEGAIDDFFRHCITKMSMLHFTSCRESFNRVIQMGEQPSRVFNVGSTAVENILNVKNRDLKELESKYNFQLIGKKYIVVTFHSVTTEAEECLSQQRQLMRAMEEISDVNYIITKANADVMGVDINQAWMEAEENHANWFVVDSLGRENYLSVLREAEMVLGNSSSGLSEAPILKIATVNIGNRQKGRTLCDSVICCDANKGEIVRAMHRARSKEFKEICQKCVNPYGQGNSSELIAEEIYKFLNEYDGKCKKFYDIPIENLEV